MKNPLIHSFITCRLDQCNSLLYGLRDTHIARLQRIQNSAARLVTRTRSSEHITPVLRKIALVTSKIPNHVQDPDFNLQIYSWSSSNLSPRTRTGIQTLS